MPQRKLLTYRVRVKVSVGAILDYFVRAPTQCSATKHTAIRDEVTDILLVEEYTETLNAADITFETLEDCW